MAVPGPRRRALLSLTAAACVPLLHKTTAVSSVPIGPTVFNANGLALQAQVGDVLFRATRSLEGQVVRWFDGASDYTHVGLLVRLADDPGWGVVHASSDTRMVSLERLETYTSVEGMAAAGLFRWRGASPVALQALQADALACVGRSFDGAFDAVDTTELYCTELIWMLARRQGWAGVPVLKPITTPLGSLRVITIDALLRHLPLQPMWLGGVDQPSEPLAV